MLTFIRGTIRWRSASLVLCETSVILGGVALAVYARLGVAALTAEEGLLYKALLIAGITQLSFYFADLYDFRVLTDRRELFIRATQALGATSVILAVLYSWLPSL